MRYEIEVSARPQNAHGIFTSRKFTIDVVAFEDIGPTAIAEAWRQGYETNHVVRAKALDVKDPYHNHMCDGAHCHSAVGPVRVYPTAGDSNLILCTSCVDHENQHRRGRNFAAGRELWPLQTWDTLKPYPSA